jgi:hypothetical protein
MHSSVFDHLEWPSDLRMDHQKDRSDQGATVRGQFFQKSSHNERRIQLPDLNSKGKRPMDSGNFSDSSPGCHICERSSL